jgi:pimeloyl-ACP methyl ester carboxylesterase
MKHVPEVGSPPALAAEEPDAPSVCRPVTFQMSAAGGQAADWTVSGDLYLPRGRVPDTIQVLLPGLTYDRRYWTVPGANNYAHHMACAGYAVLAFDRIGTGLSSRPPADQVTVDSHVAVLHEMIGMLRAGEIGGQAFSRVVTVGHSFGSGIAIVEAARHNDIDALVVSGMLHATAPLYDKVIDFFHPAAEDPVLGPAAPPKWPEWYMTQRPGYRAKMLEYADNIDPRLSEYNELIKSTATIGEGLSLPETYKPEHSLGIKVPVLIAVGQHDALFSAEEVKFCTDAAAVQEFESAFYSAEARLETHVIPSSGHSLNLHRNAVEWFEIARQWIGLCTEAHER